MNPRHLVTGAAAGLVVFAALGMTQLVATGLQAGVLVGPDGSPFQVIEPSPVIVVGGVVAVLAAAAALLLPAVRAATAIGAAIVLAGLTAWGTSRFSWEYPLATGERPWWDNLLVSGSQSLATYVVIGLAIGAAIRSGVRPAPSPHPESQTTR